MAPLWTLNNLLLGAFVAFLLAILTNGAKNNPLMKPEQLECSKVVHKVAKRHMRSFSECVKESKKSGTDNKEMHRKFQCLVKCALDKQELIDEDGKVTNVTIKQFIGDFLPEGFHEMAFWMIEPCLEEHAEEMNHDDELCKAYGEFVKCAQDMVVDMCGL